MRRICCLEGGLRMLSGRTKIPRSELSSTPVHGHVPHYGGRTCLGIVGSPKQQTQRRATDHTAQQPASSGCKLHNGAANCLHLQQGAAPLPGLPGDKPEEGDPGCHPITLLWGSRERNRDPDFKGRSQNKNSEQTCSLGQTVHSFPVSFISFLTFN